MSSEACPQVAPGRLPGSPCRSLETFVWATVAMALCVPSSAAAQALEGATPYAISARIGEEVDRQERDYFGLFPGFGEFVAARTYKDSADQVVVVAQWQSLGAAGDSTITLQAAAAAELQQYIEKLEPVVRGDATVQWDLIYEVAKIPPLILGSEDREVKIVTADGREVSGRLLLASRDLLMMWQSSEQFSWDKSDACLRPFKPAEIDQIKIETGTSAQKGMMRGALGGAVAGAALVSWLDGDEEWSSEYDVGDYLLAAGILGGLGLIGGTLYGAARGTEDNFDIRFNTDHYAKHLEAVKKYAYFQKVAPPEFRKYMQHTAD